jgi:hypothetical protein
VPIQNFSCEYLGLPLHHMKLTNAELIDKIASRLPRWRGKLLNAPCRLELVNFVLSAIPIFIVNIFSTSKMGNEED